MDLWRLHIFCKVVEQRSFSKAAAGIRLSQPTVSSHVKDLEDHFGCRLIDRVGRRIAPTHAGEMLYQRAVGLLALYDEIEAEMAGFQGRVAGRLMIGGSTIPAGYILPALIGAYRETYPQVTVSLVVGDTGKILFDILSGKVELGIVGGRTTDKRIVQQRILTDEMRVVVPAAHPWAKRKTVSVKDLIREPFIVREHGSGTRIALEENLAGQGVGIAGLNVVAELGSTEAVIQGIKNGIGVSILSSIAVAADVKAGTLKALTLRNLQLTRVFYLTLLKGRSESPAGKAFREFIEAAFLNK